MKVLSKKMLSLTLGIIMLFSSIGAIGVLAEREYAAEVSILGSVVDFQNKPFAAYDTIFVPVEELCGYLNIKVTKNADTFTTKRGETVTSFTVGNLIFSVDGKDSQLIHQPVKKNGVVYIGVDFFSESFGIPVKISEDLRSADISPNIYKVKITEENAAGVSAAIPDQDTLNTDANGSDSLFWNVENFPQKVKAVYYKADLSAFKGKEIEKVALRASVSRGTNTSPTLVVAQTPSWEKGILTYKTMSQTTKTTVSLGLSALAAKIYSNLSVNITGMAKNVLTEGNILYLRLEGRPHKNYLTKDAAPVAVMGVNTEKAPYVEVTVSENYSFPIKNESDDNAGKANYSTFELLHSLGVFSAEDEFPIDLSEGVQRQEFVRYALRLRNIVVQDADTEQLFADVPVESPYYKDIMTAHSIGIVTGGYGKEFRPYDKITIGEAVAILGRMLGYDIYAEEYGGFDLGYLSAATKGKLYTGVADGNIKLSFEKMFILLENALDAKMLNIYSFGADGSAEYTFDENMTVLTQFWDAEVIEGTVTANEYANITGGEGSKGYIAVGAKKLTLDFAPYNGLLGYKVKAYYDTRENRLLYMGSKEAKISEINLSDITGKNKNGNTISFTYKNKNGKLQTKSFSSGSGKYVIYNGKPVGDGQFTAELLDGDAGSVRLVGDNLAVITAYRTVLVSAVSAQEETIYDTYDPYARSINFKGSEYTVTDVNGKRLSLDEVKSKNVISVASSLDGKVVSAIVSTAKAVGAIEAIENSGSEDITVTVGGREYELCNTEAAAGYDKVWSDAIKLGFRSTFFLNHEGKIAGTTEKKTTDNIGYLLDAAAKGSSLNKKLQVAVVIKDSEEYVIYDLADKVEIDCVDFKDHNAIEQYFTENGEIKKQPILFDLNNEGKINKINTPTLGEKNGTLVENEEDNLCLRHTEEDAELRHKQGAVGLRNSSDGNKQFFIGKGDGMIVVKRGENFEDYYVRPSLSNGGTYNMDIYTVGSKTPEAILAFVESDSRGVNYNNYLMVVDRIVSVYDEDGMEIKKLYYHDGANSRKSVVVNPDYESEVAGFRRGDIIRFSTDYEGRLHDAVKHYDYETKTFVEGTGLGSYYAQVRVSGGYVVDVEKSYVKLSSDTNLSDMVNFSWFDASRFTNILSYTADSAGVSVKSETVDAIRSYEEAPFNPQGIILLSYYETYRPNVWIVDMPRPEGTGLYTVSYDKNTPEEVGGMPEVNNNRYDAGDTITLPDAPSRENHDFVGWQIDSATYLPGETHIITGNTTVKAQWIYNPTFEFSFVDEDGEIETIVRNWSLTDINGNPVSRTLPQPHEFTKNGYYLVGWRVGSNIYAPGTSYTPITQGATFSAVWKEVWSGEIPTDTDKPAYDAATNTYSIANGNQLAWFAKNGGSANAILTDNIYLNAFFETDGDTFDEDWYDTKSGANDWRNYMISSYKGTFDGKGNTIYGLYISGEDNSPAGFFNTISSGGVLKNTNFKGAYVVAADETSNKANGFISVVCSELSGEINRVAAGGKISAASGKYASYVGSIACVANNAKIIDCTSDVFIDLSAAGSSMVANTESTGKGIGGIVAYTKTATINVSGCTNNGKIYAPYTKRVGGIVASAFRTVNVTGCTNTAEITHAKGLNSTIDGCGQIVGWDRKGKAANVTSCTESGTLVSFSAE